MGKDAELKRIGRNLAVARARAGLTQLQVAERVGVGQHLISKWERGWVNFPISQLVRIAQVLGADPAWLLDSGTDEEQRMSEALRGQSGAPDVLVEEVAKLSPERRREFIRQLALRGLL